MQFPHPLPTLCLSLQLCLCFSFFFGISHSSETHHNCNFILSQRDAWAYHRETMYEPHYHEDEEGWRGRKRGRAREGESPPDMYGRSRVRVCARKIPQRKSFSPFHPPFHPFPSRGFEKGYLINVDPQQGSRGKETRKRYFVGRDVPGARPSTKSRVWR